MGSRRITTRASFGNGRSSNGEEVSGSSRPGSCSYLSNVRPENRSTLCSVIAQLTEETQPAFEITLKSRAVSENCNVKFSCVVTGHPTPQVLWYKDDMQLDRYCGLPKYEVFRNGQSHSLHIYNCTVDDAAIYQASASNSKGIVSCSGVLEVGEMNEFKIHQRYFGKLKQKAENKHKEAEGKENQEPLRTISPDRTLRKRRSTMDAFLSAPSSTEDEGVEVSPQTVPMVTEARVQEVETVEKVEEKPVPITNGEVSPATSENMNKSGTYMYDSAQKIFTAHKPKTPFVKKKLKISNSAEVAKLDTPGERTTEERRALSSDALNSTEPGRSEGGSDEVMEVEDTVCSSAVDLNTRNVREQPQKSGKVAVFLTEKPSEDKKRSVGGSLPSHKEPQAPSLPPATIASKRPSEDRKVSARVTSPSHKKSPAPSVPPATITSKRPSEDKKVSSDVALPSHKELPNPSVPPATNPSKIFSKLGTMGKQVAKNEKDDGSRNKKEKLETPKINPRFTSAKQQPSAAEVKQQRKVKEDISETERATAMDVDKKSSTSAGGPLAHRGARLVNASCENQTVLPQHLYEVSADQLSETETSPHHKNVSVSGPALLREVTQAQTKMTRNDAPVILKPQPYQHSTDAQPPQKTPYKKETQTDDNQTHSLHSVPQVADNIMTQDTRDHTRGSNEIHTLLYTDLHKSSLQSPAHAESPQGCKVSSIAKQSPVDTAIKTVEGTEIQVDEKVESNGDGRFLAQSDRWAPQERVVEMETDISASHVRVKTDTEKITKAADQQTNAVIVDTPEKESKKNVQVQGLVEETTTEIHHPEPTTNEQSVLLQTKTQENTISCQSPVQEIQEITTPVTKIISIAEILRAQIKALESTLARSLTTLPLHADYVQEPPASEACMEIKDINLKPEVAKSTLPKAKETLIDFAPLRNLKATLMEVYHQLNKTDQELSPTQVEASPPPQKQTVTTPISGEDTDTTAKTDGLNNSAMKQNECAMDVCTDTKVLPVVPPEHSTDVSSSGGQSVSFPPKEEMIYSPVSKLSGAVTREPETPLTVTPIKAGSQGANITGLGQAEAEPAPSTGIKVTRLTPEITLNSEAERGRSGVDSATFLDQNKVEEAKNSSQISSKSPAVSAQSMNIQENNIQFTSQDSSRTSSPASLTPEASPLSKRRNCVSPIPSATPQELASGARRKIILSKAKPEDVPDNTSTVDSQSPKTEVSVQSNRLSASPVKVSTSPGLSRRSPLLQPSEPTSLTERHSPILSRKKTAPETQASSQLPSQEIQMPKTEGKPVEKDKQDPFKAPQVIRKIRGESYADASGHLKLWCQFFNVLSDSTIKWYKNEEEIAWIKRQAGDEAQVNLAIVQASSKDSGVYGCTITNEYGTDSTDYLLSADILAGFSLREDLSVGEEIEMMPLIYSRGVADSGVWGNKFFGRIMMQESRIGDGCSHKVWRAKVIYGLEPVFESGNTCIIKVSNPISYGGKGESCLIDRNLEIVKQECKIQNLAREYCKIFAAEARVIEHFGPPLEVNPVYLIYRPANTVPYATVEADLTGVYQKFSVLDQTGRFDVKTESEVERKCCALQHWIHQWTHGNLLLTQLEGVDTKITRVGITVKSTGHQGLSLEGNPKVFEQFAAQHQCNYFCGLLGLRSLKIMDSLSTPTKPKGSRSPLLQRKTAAGSSSPQTARKATGSPRMPRKTETEGTKQKSAEVAKAD